MRVGSMIREWRQMQMLRTKNDKAYGIRAVAREIGITHGTLSRIELGEGVDGNTMIKLMFWLFKEELQSDYDKQLGQRAATTA